MDIIQTLIGSGEELNVVQMSVRAVIIYFVTLLLIRLGGIRILGKKSALDNIIIILLGAVLARGVVGASPFLSTIAAATVMVFLSKLLTRASVSNKRLDHLCKGKEVVLYENGHFISDNLKRVEISEADFMESLRLETNTEQMDKVEKATMETCGRISFVLKQ